MSDEQDRKVGEIVSGPLKGQSLRSAKREDGSWAPTVILYGSGDASAMAFQHLGEGRYRYLPGTMIWTDRFEARYIETYEVVGDDVWPPAITVERWQRSEGDGSGFEARLVERRVYVPKPDGEIEQLRDLEEPRWPTPPEAERMQEKNR